MSRKVLALTFIISTGFIIFLVQSTLASAESSLAPAKQAAILQIPTVATPATSSVRSRVQDVERERKLNRVRTAVEVRERVLAAAITRTEAILAKLQIRITKAQEAGKDVTQLNSLMADANKQLADAKFKLSQAQTQKVTAADKASFEEIRVNFKTIVSDLHLAREDAAKMVRILKGFNSATSQGRNPQREGTSPATRK